MQDKQPLREALMSSGTMSDDAEMEALWDRLIVETIEFWQPLLDVMTSKRYPLRPDTTHFAAPCPMLKQDPWRKW